MRAVAAIDMGDDLPRRGPTGPAGAFSIQVLVDADNVTGPRLNALLRALRDVPARIVAAGSRESLRAVSWPGVALLFPREGWQRADVALADAYTPTPGPLVIVSGDGDFSLLAARHPGPVLVHCHVDPAEDVVPMLLAGQTMDRMWPYSEVSP